jgi:hypothetical protein
MNSRSPLDCDHLNPGVDSETTGKTVEQDTPFPGLFDG